MDTTLVKTQPSRFLSSSFETGAWMLGSLIAFFLVMYGLGLGYRPELSLFNIVIQMAFMYAAIRNYYKHHPADINNYLSGAAQGVVASAVGIGGFTVFMTVFNWANPAFLETVRQNTPLGSYLDPLMACLFILVEGVAVALIWSYIATRILGARSKRDERYVE